MKNIYRMIFLAVGVLLIISVPGYAGIDKRYSDYESTYIIPRDTVKKVCRHTDSTLLSEVKQKKEALNNEISDLIAKKKEMEKKYDGSRDEKYRIKEIKKKISKLENNLDKLNKKIYTIMRCVESKYLDNGKDVVRFMGNAEILKEDKIGNISLINGDLLVKGIVDGDVVSINGRIICDSGGKINGKITLINSEFIADTSNTNYVLCGEIGNYEEYSYNNYFPYFHNFPRYHFPPTDFIDDGIIRYNRVEGLYFGLKADKKYYWNERRRHSFYGSFGYGFSIHRWTGSLGFDRWIGNENRTEFGVETHSIVDSKDNWLIDPMENSLAAFFIHEDFKDYFMREGWSVHAAQYLDKSTRVRVDYIEDNYSSLSRNTDWALFGGDKRFRENPVINDGRLKSVIFSINHVTFDRKQYRPSGWDINANYEIADGAYTFNRFAVDIRRYQPIDLFNRINLRVMAGTSEKFLPLQRSFEIGGLGTLPALPFKSFSGNRMLLANIEYLVGLNDFFDILFDSDLHLGDQNDLIVFFDAGWVNNVSDDCGMFKGFEINDNIKRDVGIALGFNRNTIRIGAAFRLDRSEPGVFFLRVSRPF